MILKQADGRLWEIDFLRGIAIILMIIFHFIYDLNHFSIIYYRLWEGPFAYTSSIIASVFVVLVGISLTINYNKKKNKMALKEIKKQWIIRGLKLFSLGLLITAISFIIIPERFVIFGILHCIGLSIIFSIPFINYTWQNLIIGSILISSGLYLRVLTFDFSYLIPLGFLPPKYYTIDYFPLLPWFGVVLIGISLGHLLYPEGQRRFHLTDHPMKGLSQNICFIGRHSLHIYFLHQPVLVLIVLMFMLF